MKYSNCCNASPKYELQEEFGRCPLCAEICEWEEEEDKQPEDDTCISCHESRRTHGLYCFACGQAAEQDRDKYDRGQVSYRGNS